MAIAPGLKRRGGLFGASAQPPMAPEMTATANPMAPAKPKFFGEGGVGRAIAGNIGDFLLQYSGMQPIYQPAVQQRQAMAYDQQQRAMQRRQGLEDWVAKEQWDRANPKPVNNDTVADYEYIRGKLGEDAANDFLRNKANPPVWRQGADMQWYRVDTSPQTAPTITQDEWDKGTPVNGGPTPSASGGFR